MNRPDSSRRGTGSAARPGDEPTPSPAPPGAVPPGTEEPRSFGDWLREAQAQAQAQAASSADDAPSEGASVSDAHQGTGASAAAANRTTGKGERKVGPGGGRKGPRKPSRARQKRLSRERAVQALYQWDLSAGQASSIRQEILDTQEFSKADVGFFELLFNGVSHDPDSVDAELQRALDRPIAELDPIERAVLRLAAYELATQLDTPARVIINEGVEITRRFGADNGHRYVNGVLDKLARYLRPLEMKPR